MNKSIVILTLGLSALIVYNMLRVTITYAYYEIDPVGFIERLCENKDKPELQCNGKCHLKKVSQSSGDDKAPSQLINFEELVLFNERLTHFNFSNFRILREKVSFQYINLYNYHHNSSCFHPPQV